MLKETEAEETTVFFVTFFIMASISIGGGPLAPPGYAYDLSSLTLESKNKKRVVS